MPAITLPLMTIGAAVPVCAMFELAFCTFQITLPVVAFSAVTCPSRVRKYSFPFQNAGPRLTTSQQAVLTAAPLAAIGLVSCSGGTYFHRIRWLARLIAVT